MGGNPTFGEFHGQKKVFRDFRFKTKIVQVLGNVIVKNINP